MLFDTTYKAVTTIVNNIEKYKSNSIDDALPYLADLNIEQRACFNSSMVRLGGNELPNSELNRFLFQFQYGSIGRATL